MKKSIQNLGKILSKSEQKKVGGGQYNCGPTVSQMNCDEYCEQVSFILQHEWLNENTHNVRTLMRLMTDVCGGYDPNDTPPRFS
ncbi:hypothetical protein [Spongiimicrobium salis]|uniref:hypothetical protein n=1 Tax=Spongiimicrobium salis TaxID=1667022 RepID=UPI00374D2177